MNLLIKKDFDIDTDSLQLDKQKHYLIELLNL